MTGGAQVPTGVPGPDDGGYRDARQRLQSGRGPRGRERRLLDRLRGLMHFLPGGLPTAVLLLVAAILLLLGALVVLSGGDGSGPTDDASGTDPTAAQVDGSGEGCLLSGVLEVTSTPTETYEGEHAVQHRGEVSVTNTSDEPVQLATFHSFSTGGEASTWGGGDPLGAGATVTIDVTGQSFENGDTTWDVVTEVVAYTPTPECHAIFGTADADQYGDFLVRVTNPLPVGP